MPDVPGTGQRNRTGASSGADFGFRHLSAQEGRRRLGSFRDGRRLMGAKVTRGTILVVGIHPPAVGQICVLCMQVHLRAVLRYSPSQRANGQQLGQSRMEHLASSKLTRAEVCTPVTPCRALHFRLPSVSRPVPRLAVAFCMVAGGSGTGVEDDSNSSHTAHICGSYCGYAVGTTWPARA